MDPLQAAIDALPVRDRDLTLKVYPTARLYLTEGWYTRADVEQLMWHFESQDRALAASMKQSS